MLRRALGGVGDGHGHGLYPPAGRASVVEGRAQDVPHVAGEGGPGELGGGHLEQFLGPGEGVVEDGGGDQVGPFGGVRARAGPEPVGPHASHVAGRLGGGHAGAVRRVDREEAGPGGEGTVAVAAGRVVRGAGGGGDLGGHVREHEAQALEVDHRAAELPPGLGVGDRVVQGGGRQSDRAGGDTQAPPVEQAGGDQEPLAGAADEPLSRYPCPVEHHRGGR